MSQDHAGLVQRLKNWGFFVCQELELTAVKSQPGFKMVAWHVVMRTWSLTTTGTVSLFCLCLVVKWSHWTPTCGPHTPPWSSSFLLHHPTLPFPSPYIHNASACCHPWHLALCQVAFLCDASQPSSSPTVAIISAMSAISQRHPSLALCSLVRLSSKKFSFCPLGHSGRHSVITISFLLIILSWDIQLNPGPTRRHDPKFPCGCCQEDVDVVRKPFVVIHVMFGFSAPAQVCQTHNILT